MRVISLSSLSLAGGSGIAEAKVPLWWSSGSIGSGSITSTTPTYYFSDGHGPISGTSDSSTKLFILSSNWPSNTKFSFEASIYVNSTSAIGYAELWDITAGVAVSSSQVSSSVGSFTVVRSGQFTLVPGHQYGVTLWVSNSSYVVQVTDPTLVIFP